MDSVEAIAVPSPPPCSTTSRRPPRGAGGVGGGGGEGAHGQRGGYRCAILAPVLHAVLLAAAEVPAAPVVGAMTFGVVVALVGHVTKDAKVGALGVGGV